MLNAIWVAMIFGALVCGAFTGHLDAVARATTDSAKSAVELAIGLVGVMAFWLGMMRVLHEAGLLVVLARALKPLTRRLFPEVPADHPAMSMMILNFTANMLGLANAATPFGLKAMMELDKLNPHKGTASNSMALFLAINTSGLALLPTGMIAVRASLGSTAPGSILVTTLVATAAATLTAVVITKLIIALRLSPLPTVAAPAKVSDASRAAEPTRWEDELSEVSVTHAGPQAAAPLRGLWRYAYLALALLLLGAVAWAFYQRAMSVEAGAPVGVFGALKTLVSQWTLVLLVAGIVLYGVFHRVKVYDAVVEGGKEGFSVALRIIPFLVAILVAVGMLRASGAIDLGMQALAPLTNWLGMPAEALPMALLRPLSGSGALGVASEIMSAKDASGALLHGPDSLVGTIVSTMQGSTETTFYVLAVYFGAVGVKNARFTLVPCLLADAVGALAAVWACRLLLF